MGLAKKRVVLHSKDGSTFEGILLRRKPLYVLELADLITKHPETGATEKTQIKGRVNVERENVSFFQVLS
jgi:hypothetical protein